MIEDLEFYWKTLDTLKDGVYFANRDRKITYWNKAAEELTGYKSSEVLGKCCKDNILIHIDEQGNNLCTGECPLARCMVSGQPNETSVYLHHKKGHRVPVTVRVNPVRDAGGKIVGAVEIFSNLSSRDVFVKRIQALRQPRLLDPVTELPTREYLEIELKSRLRDLSENAWPFGILYMKINHLMDRKEEPVSMSRDTVLKIVAGTLVNNISPFDIIGRWSDEDFVAILPNVAADGLHELAVRYCFLIEKSEFPGGDEPIQITVSIGAVMAEPDNTEKTLIEKAIKTIEK